MATRLDRKFAALATKMIAKNGQTPSSYVSMDKGGFNTTTDSTTVVETPRTGFKVAPPNVVSAGYLRKLGTGENSGAPLLAVGDAITYIAAADISGWVPGLGDVIVFAGLTKRWGVVNVRPLVSGEQVAAFELTCRSVGDGEGT